MQLRFSIVFTILFVTSSLYTMPDQLDHDDFDISVVNWQGETGSEVTWERMKVYQGRGALCWTVQIDKRDNDRWKDIFRKPNTFKTDWRDYDGLEVWCYLEGKSRTGYSLSLFVGGSVNADLGRKYIPPYRWIQVRWYFPHWLHDFSQVTWFAFNLDEADWDDRVKIIILLDNLRLFKSHIEPNSVSLLKTLVDYPTLPVNFKFKFQVTSPFKLTFRSFTSNGKVIFLLNDQPFFPIAITIGTGVPIASLERIHCEGIFNSIVLATGTMDTPTQQLLSWCRQNRLPVIISYSPSDFWEWLSQNPEGCMRLPDSKPVINFPDFANPKTVQRFLSSWARFCNDLREWLNDPVIAIDIGAYDLYHVPDGEIHLRFQTPSKPPFVQNLPAGPFVRTNFLTFLKGLGFSLQQLGLSSWDSIVLPRHRMEAPSETYWYAWLWYRREYVRSFRNTVAEKVRKWTNLPVTCSYDLNFALDENWATPPHLADDGVDFLMVYAYKLRPEPLKELPRLWEHLSLRFRQLGKPLVALMEVTSALPDNYTPAVSYLVASLPYVAGFVLMDACEGFDVPSRYFGFVKAVRAIDSQRLWEVYEQPAEVIVLWSTKDVYVTLEPTTLLLANLGVPFDIAYDDLPVPVQQFSMFLIPLGQPLLEKELLKWRRSDVTVIVEAEGDHLLHHLTKLHKYRTYDPKLWDALRYLSTMLSVPETFLASLLKNREAWNNELGDLVQWAEGTLFVRKRNSNEKGVWWKEAITPPFILDFVLCCEEGKPRVTLMPPDRSGEISIGQDSDGVVGVWVQGRWIPICYAPIAQRHRYRVAIVPVDERRELLALQVMLSTGQQRLVVQILPQCFATYRLTLFWAWDDAVAQLHCLSLMK